MEGAVVRGNLSAETRGQYLSFILGMTAIVIGGVLLWNGKNVEGLIAILGTLGTLAGVFIWGRRRQERERAEKLADNKAPARK